MRATIYVFMEKYEKLSLLPLLTWSTDQTPHSSQSDLGWHWLHIFPKWVSSLRRVNLSTYDLQVLHLIGLALHEQKSAIEAGNHEFDFLSRACGQAKDTAKTKKGKDC